jgi:hypothetical protein
VPSVYVIRPPKEDLFDLLESVSFSNVHIFFNNTTRSSFCCCRCRVQCMGERKPLHGGSEERTPPLLGTVPIPFEVLGRLRKAPCGREKQACIQFFHPTGMKTDQLQQKLRRNAYFLLQQQENDFGDGFLCRPPGVILPDGPLILRLRFSFDTFLVPHLFRFVRSVPGRAAACLAGRPCSQPLELNQLREPRSPPSCQAQAVTELHQLREPRSPPEVTVYLRRH